MGKMNCRCGYLFDLTPCPTPYQWVDIKDTDRKTFINAEAEANHLTKVSYEKNKERIAKLDQLTHAVHTLIYNCPVCNRIIWFRGEDGGFEVFTPESIKP